MSEFVIKQSKAMKFPITLLILFCTSFSTSFAGKSSTSFVPNKLPSANEYEEVDFIFEDILEKTKVAGISISASLNGKMIYSKGFGYSDVKNKVAILPDTKIRTASIAKVITTTALGRLASEGKLDFDSPLKNYIPYLKEPYSSLTTRQIAGHTSGIPHRPTSKNLAKKRFNEVKETLTFFDDASLLFTPNTDYKYSTLGYNLLAILIEEVSGKKYVDFMKENVFEKLGMNQTYPDHESKLASTSSKMYFLNNEKLKLDNKILDGSYKLAGAGFRSTSIDLVKMMKAYKNGFINEKVVSEMFSNRSLTNEKKTNVGIGWRLNKDIDNNPTVEHAGNWQGARTVIVYYPNKDLTISIMINTKCTIFIEETAHIIAQFFLKENDKGRNSMSKSLAIENNRSDGSIENYKGKIEFEDNIGELTISTDRQWLAKNAFYYLPSKNNIALSTKYGLLFLRIKESEKLEGNIYQYQVMSDKNHMLGKPMLVIRENE